MDEVLRALRCLPSSTYIYRPFVCISVVIVGRSRYRRLIQTSTLSVNSVVMAALSSQQQHTLALAGVAAVAALATARILYGSSASLPSFAKQAFHSKSAQDLNPDPAVFELQCFTRLLAAFGSSGLNAPGTKDGVMIASPSRPGDRWNKTLENDNYFYQWPRDSGLCVRMVVRRWARALEGRQVGMPGGQDWLAGALKRAKRGQILPSATDLSQLKKPCETADEIEQIIQE